MSFKVLLAYAALSSLETPYKLDKVGRVSTAPLGASGMALLKWSSFLLALLLILSLMLGLVFVEPFIYNINYIKG